MNKINCISCYLNALMYIRSFTPIYAHKYIKDKFIEKKAFEIHFRNKYCGEKC